MASWPILAALIVFLPLWRISTVGALPSSPLMWGILAILAMWIAGQDRQLGFLALYVGVRGFLTRLELSFETSFVVIAGLLLVATAQRAPGRVRPWITTMAVASGVFQVAFSALQWWALPPVRAWIAGSVGNPTYLGSYLAISGALAPVWLLPVFLGGIVLTRSMGGAVALAVALAVRYRKHPWRVMAGTVVLVLATVWHHSLGPVALSASLWKRLVVIQLSMTDLARSVLGVLIGYGPGGWIRRFPQLQYNAGYAVTEIHGQAHNEYVQLLYEGGLVALGLLGLWLWSRRKILAGSPYLPAVVALGVSALTMFPFQVAATAVLGLTVLGFATQETVR